MKVFTEQQMRAAEQAASDAGMSFLRLMENAGAACAAEIKSHTNRADKTVVLCGRGKNGGDGFVIARKLADEGYAVVVLLSQGEPKDEDAAYMFAKLSGTNVRVFDLSKNTSMLRLIGEADVLVDAVFGIGFRGAADDTLAGLFRLVNAAKGTVFAVDLPSGLACDSKEVESETIRADYTLAISAAKPCHVLLPAAERCGTVLAVRIGVEDSHYRQMPYYAYTFSQKEAKAVFPNRPAVSNKGDFGKVLSVCGSRGFAGAAVLAAEGALRSGAGLVYAAFPQSAYAAIGGKLTESVLLPMPDDSEGRFASAAIPYIADAMQDKQAVLLGCGLGQSAGTRELTQFVLENATCPVVLDADGLNLIASDIDILRKANCKLFLTPHPGEMARLLGVSVSEVQEDRVRIASEFARSFGVTVVLKGANTVVAGRKGGPVYLNTTGNSGMAKGGSGDFLAGLLAGLIAQGVHFPAETAVYLHGLCGDRAAKKLSVRGMLPTDCIRELPYVLSEFE